jgi:multiple sugar transport system permease protein
VPIISDIGRRHPRTRLLREGIFILLVLGAVSMLYPFLLMLGGSVRSQVDLRERGVVPAYLRDDTALWRKHVESLFDERLDAARSAYDEDLATFEALMPPPAARERLVGAWHDFLRETRPGPTRFALGHLYAPLTRVQPRNLRGFKAELARESPRIEDLNQRCQTDFASWTAFVLPTEDLLPRRTRPGTGPLDQLLAAFKLQQPEAYRVYYCADGYFKSLYLKARYGREIAGYNRSHGTAFESYANVRLTRRAPLGPPAVRADWEDFVRRSLGLVWLRLDPAAAPAWRDYLQAKYGDLALLNRRHGAAYGGFADIALPEVMPVGGVALTDWESFVGGWTDPATGRMHAVPVDQVEIRDNVFAFQDFLRARFGDIASLNPALGTGFAGFEEIRPPQKEAHFLAALEQARELRREFVVRNYATVLDYLLHHGRGLINTVIYCGLAVLCALLFNPLAAYALSRYRPASTYRILLFLLLTMAFPPMVTQIPAFLLLRDLHLLNTFWALVLPGLANGYSIFLLKGFFDSLPRELYEQAQLDGAGEWTMFWRLTMSLSKPILAVTALHAFTAAYANFMFALLICQDQRMWTLMVWLYQLQQRSGPGVIQASLVVAALPTLLIFVFCQRIILRGIVVPVEK